MEEAAAHAQARTKGSYVTEYLATRNDFVTKVRRSGYEINNTETHKKCTAAVTSALAAAVRHAAAARKVNMRTAT